MELAKLLVEPFLSRTACDYSPLPRSLGREEEKHLSATTCVVSHIRWVFFFASLVGCIPFFLCFRAKLKQFSFCFEENYKIPTVGFFFVFFSPKEKDTIVDLFFHVILRVGCWKWVAEWDNKINGLHFGESEDPAQWRWEDCEYSFPPLPPDPSVFFS
jgi:hypothetical protein